MCGLYECFFFCKQKTAYEMRISDWSSDVCSSDLATTVMFEGVPNFPDYSRFWQVIDKHQVEIFYAAPTALRALMREGDEFVTRTSRKSLKLMGPVGEPLHPQGWASYHRVLA